MKCHVDFEKYMKCIAEDWVYIFFVGFDYNLDQISSCILYYLSWKKHINCSTDMCTKNHSERSVLVVQKGKFRPALPIGFSTRHCTCYDNITRIVNIYWKKHGYSEWYKVMQAERKNNRKSFVALSMSDHSYASHIFWGSYPKGDYNVTLLFFMLLILELLITWLVIFL